MPRILVGDSYPLPLAVAPRTVCAAGGPPALYSADAVVAVAESAPCPTRLRVVEFPGGRLAVAVESPDARLHVPVPADALESFLLGARETLPGVEVSGDAGGVVARYGSAVVRAEWGALSPLVEVEVEGALGATLAAPPGWLPERPLRLRVDAGSPRDLGVLAARLALVTARSGPRPAGVWAAGRAVVPLGARRRLVARSGEGVLRLSSEWGSPGWGAWLGWRHPLGAAAVEAWLLPGPYGLLDAGVAPRGAPVPPPAPLPLVRALLETGEPRAAAEEALGENPFKLAPFTAGDEYSLQVSVRAHVPGGVTRALVVEAAPPAPLRLLAPVHTGYTVVVRWGPRGRSLLERLAEAAWLYWSAVPGGAARWAAQP